MTPATQLVVYAIAIFCAAVGLAAFGVCTEKVFSEVFGAIKVRLRWTNHTAPQRQDFDRARFHAAVLASFTPVSDEAEQMVRASMSRLPPPVLRVVPNHDERTIRVEVR